MLEVRRRESIALPRWRAGARSRRHASAIQRADDKPEVRMGEASSCTRGPRFGIEVRELSDREREMLIEEANMAWRSRSPDGPTLEHHTADLDAAARQMVFDETSIMCVLDAALDRDAYSTIMRAVAAATARG
jgi:hypothetical protein